MRFIVVRLGLILETISLSFVEYYLIKSDHAHNENRLLYF